MSDKTCSWLTSIVHLPISSPSRNIRQFILIHSLHPTSNERNGTDLNMTKRIINHIPPKSSPSTKHHRIPKFTSHPLCPIRMLNFTISVHSPKTPKPSSLPTTSINQKRTKQKHTFACLGLAGLCGSNAA